ncbi:MAG: tRNA pseudouridine(38-40) synthase TruA [Thermoanaerobaculia bacterium]
MSQPARYRAVLAYVGTDFHGWQAQSNVSRTVQAVLERALAGFAGGPVRAQAAGRTDTGVHADGQVVHFDLPTARDPARVRDGVNARLPRDVRLLEAALAASDFHARRDAVWKEYLYRWGRAPVIPPRDALFVAPICAGADPFAMQSAAEALAGRRDFAVFGVRHRSAESTVRTIRFVRVAEAGDEIHALFRGDGFLRGMVRSVCGVLAEVGRGRVPASRLRDLLETGDRRLLRQKAPPCGLTLLRVHYEE